MFEYNSRKKDPKQILAKIKFKSITRRVIDNIGWLSPEGELKRQLDAVSRGFNASLFIKDHMRLTLLKDPKYRSEEEIEKTVPMLENFPCFKGYTKEVQKELCKIAQFVYTKRGQIIIKAGQTPTGLYCILNGCVEISRTIKNTKGDQFEKVTRAHRGKMFGDHSLYYRVPRRATVVSLIDCEMLFVSKEDFERILRGPMSQKWDRMIELKQLFHKYFDRISEIQWKDICVYGTIIDYNMNDIVYDSSVRSTLRYAYFLIDGKCDLLERLDVKRSYSKKVKTVLINPKIEEEPRKQEDKNKLIGRESIRIDSRRSLIENEMVETPRLSIPSRFSDTGPTLISTRVKSSIQVRKSCRKLLTTHAKGPMKPTILKSYLREISGNTNPDGGGKFAIENHLMKVCSFSQSACFNIGEIVSNRLVYAKRPTKILLVPRIILFREKSSMWHVVSKYLNHTLPNGDKLFDIYVKNCQYRQYKRQMIRSILRPQKSDLKSGNYVGNIPYSIRIRNDFHFADEILRIAAVNKSTVENWDELQ